MRRLVRYAATGLVNSFVGLAVIFGLHIFAGFSDRAANLAGFGVGMGVSFALNRTWTFGDGGNQFASLARFALAFGVAYLANLAVLNVLISADGVPWTVAQAVAVMTYSITFFLLCRNFVFRQPTR